MKNDYYEIACEDLAYLQATLSLPYFNQISVNAQQVAEKMLKSVAERICIGIEKLMCSHNLRAIYTAIYQMEPSFNLDKGKLSMLKEVCSDGKYNPGDNFVEVDKESCNECLDIMYDVVEAVNAIRTTLDLPVKSFDRKMLCIQS